MSDKDKPVEEPKVEPIKEPEPKAQASNEPVAVGKDQYGRQLYEVTCASCGKKTQVPFKPSGNRPVYCRDCYMQQRRGGMGGGMGRGQRR